MAVEKPTDRPCGVEQIRAVRGVRSGGGLLVAEQPDAERAEIGGRIVQRSLRAGQWQLATDVGGVEARILPGLVLLSLLFFVASAVIRRCGRCIPFLHQGDYERVHVGQLGLDRGQPRVQMRFPLS
jgi:hypothetical protein